MIATDGHSYLYVSTVRSLTAVEFNIVLILKNKYKNLNTDNRVSYQYFCKPFHFSIRKYPYSVQHSYVQLSGYTGMVFFAVIKLH